MKLSPYIIFNGNCAEAIAFYEQAFSVKAEFITYYKDAPSEHGYQTPKEQENLVMHSQIKLGDEIIMLCDMPPESPVAIGGNIAIMAEFTSVTVTKAVFDKLKEDGKVEMELQKTFWSECFGTLTDKFGIIWNVSVGYPSE